jgi:hypothetical protein
MFRHSAICPLAAVLWLSATVFAGAQNQPQRPEPSSDCSKGITSANGTCVSNVDIALRKFADCIAQQRISYIVCPAWLPSPDVGVHSKDWDVTGFRTILSPPGGAASDIRLKFDIAQVGLLDNGIKLYRFRYIWSDQVYVGVMAQQVAEIRPDAVVMAPNGYLAVYYDKLGLKMETWDEWKATH